MEPLEVPKPVEPKPVEAKPMVRTEGPTTGPDQRKVEGASTAAIVQWAGFPPKDKRRVVVDEGPV